MEAKYHWYSWILSVNLAKQHFDEVNLYTDSFGANVLCDEIGLPFTDVCVCFDNLEKRISKEFWAIGKLVSISKQDKPFMHIDSDVYLWKPLNNIFLNSKILTQAEEDLSEHNYYRRYRELIDNSIYIPQLLKKFRNNLRAYNCGILGGIDVDFFNLYSERVLDFLFNKQNQTNFKTKKFTEEVNAVYEQYYLAILAKEYNINVKTLFQEFWPKPSQARRVGYTHLLGNAKCRIDVLEALEIRIQKEFETYHLRVPEI